MIWALLSVAAIFGLTGSRRFRRVALAVAALLAAVVLAWVVHEKERSEAEKRLVRADQLTFEDMRLGQSYGSVYTFSGRVKNNSRFTVIGITARIRVLDCGEGSNCEVVGEEESDIGPIIPPGQVRDIDQPVPFDSGTRVRGQFSWSYAIGDIRARP